ncbi:hypothetical protein JCM19236_2104 [Vibrio sp. JCM 19236]|nr:hypothetical protein JCM19236_2104 [Vibrio sp. JCM 19236]
MRLALCTISLVFASTVYADDIALPDELVSVDEMQQSRGGQHIELDYTSLASDIDGFSSGNSAINTVNGNNVLSSGAFADSSGISNVIQNTGNNVLIQNSTVVNLTLK